MSALPYQPPQVCDQALGRLALVDREDPAPSGRRDSPGWVDWNDVHLRIQRVLDGMAARVTEAAAGITSRPGMVRARAIDLFSYRVFYPIGKSAVDPVVVGVTFGVMGDTLRIRGDIAGEESGEIFFDQDGERQLRSPTADEVATEGVRLAEHLAKQVPVVVEALARKRVV